MRVLAAPDKLKGSLSAQEAAQAIAAGARAAGPSVEVEACPVADGGEGTLDVLLPALGGRELRVRVTGPLGDRVEARFGWVEATRTAIIESAEAIGLVHVPSERRSALTTTSRGLGELIVAALDAGAERLLIGLGGSATSDAGVGMARALGVRFANIGEHARGIDLARIDAVDASQLDPRLAAATVVAACDVDNPLTGEHGAARVYAPQKGATAEEALALDAALARFATLVPGTSPLMPRTGAAGGLGFSLRAFLGATLESGADLVLDLIGFDARLAGADVVLTAEGRIDAQTTRGKAVARVAARAARAGIPCIALAGSVSLSEEQRSALSLCAALPICPGPISEAEALARSAELLSARAADVTRLWLAASDGGRRDSK